jgi:hypothetical protein
MRIFSVEVSCFFGSAWCFWASLTSSTDTPKRSAEPVGNRLHNVIGIDSMPSQALQVCQASALNVATHFDLGLKDQSPWMSRH